MSRNRLYTNMLRIHLFSIFTIKMPKGASAAKTLTNVLYNILTEY